MQALGIPKHVIFDSNVYGKINFQTVHVLKEHEAKHGIRVQLAPGVLLETLRETRSGFVIPIDKLSTVILKHAESPDNQQITICSSPLKIRDDLFFTEKQATLDDPLDEIYNDIRYLFHNYNESSFNEERYKKIKEIHESIKHESIRFIESRLKSDFIADEYDILMRTESHLLNDILLNNHLIMRSINPDTLPFEIRNNLHFIFNKHMAIAYYFDAYHIAYFSKISNTALSKTSIGKLKGMFIDKGLSHFIRTDFNHTNINENENNYTLFVTNDKIFKEISNHLKLDMNFVPIADFEEYKSLIGMNG